MKKCAKCGEESEDQFDSCWNCQTAFDDGYPENSQHELAEDVAGFSSDHSRPGYFWLASILVPLGLILLGYAAGISRGGWEGLVPVVISFVLAAVSAIGLALISVARQEKAAVIALVAALVGLGFLVFVGVAITKR